MKAYIGSTNINKVNAVKQVLEPYGYEVVGLAVDSQVGSQPLNDEQTIKGALNRAMALPQDGIRIGLEAGVALLNNILYLTNYGVLIDESNQIYYAGGTRIPLPPEIKELILVQKYELSDAMEIYFHTKDIKHQNGAIAYFTDNQVIRIDIFTHIVKLLYGQMCYNRRNKR